VVTRGILNSDVQVAAVARSRVVVEHRTAACQRLFCCSSAIYIKKMSDYPLRRTRSVLVVPASKPAILLSRTKSVADLYRPTYRRDWDLNDDYWYDRYYYYTPTYYPRYRRYNYSDYLINPYSSYYSGYYNPYSSSYWPTRYSYDYTGYYRRYTDAYFDRYLNQSYYPRRYYSNYSYNYLYPRTYSDSYYYRYLY